MRKRSSTQLTMDFEPGLAERHDTLKSCVREQVCSSRKPLKALAADMDLSQSELNRKLSGNLDDPRNFSVDDLERYLQVTGDTTPILYLVEKYLQDEDTKRERVISQLQLLLPDLVALVKQARD